MEIREVKVSCILNRTSIDLGEYVINPYRGCENACLYCYARFNKKTLKDHRNFGEYVDVRINAPEVLNRELEIKKPKCVLLGSTTECFQSTETKYRLTYQILNILNQHRIQYYILTRSPTIVDYMPLLKSGFCKGIYFTINSFNDKLKNLLEPNSAPFKSRIESILNLSNEGIKIIVYFSPILPYISNTKDLFSYFDKTVKIELEGLNFNLGNIENVIDSIGTTFPKLKGIYKKMQSDSVTYDDIWQDVKNKIDIHAKSFNRDYYIYLHKFNGYFQNRYINKSNEPENY